MKSDQTIEEHLTELMLKYSAEMYKYKNIMNPTTRWQDLTAHQRSVVLIHRGLSNEDTATT